MAASVQFSEAANAAIVSAMEKAIFNSAGNAARAGGIRVVGYVG
jgi:hypothetical protein